MSWRKIDASSRRAIVFTPLETRRQILVEAAVLAEELGYEAVIIPEGWGLDASVVLAEIAMRTERITLVAGILSIWNRSPATIAMTAATLDDLSDGRFVLGLGASTAALTEGLHDVAFRAPTAKLRATIAEVRALLNGDRASTSHAARALRLGQAPRPDLPIWVAGLGPNSIRTAAQLGDGWLPAMLPRSAFDATRTATSRFANDRCEIITCVMAGADHAEATGRSQAEQIVGWYLTGMGPFYGDVAAGLGFEAEVDAVRAANPRPTPGSIVWPREADDLLGQLAVFGDPDGIRAGLDVWDRLTDVVAVSIAPGSRTAVSALIEAAAPAQSAVIQASASAAAASTSTSTVASTDALPAEVEASLSSSSRSRR